VSLYVFARDLASFYGLALMFGFSYGAVMPLYAIIAPEYFGARITGTMFGAVNMASTLGMALDPCAGGWLYDVYGSYFWLYIGSFGIGLGAVAIALTFRPPRELSAPLPSPSIAQRAKLIRSRSAGRAGSLLPFARPALLVRRAPRAERVPP
jgi:MFS family permease